MKNQLYCKLLSCLIEWHWLFINHNRRKISYHLSQGTPLVSRPVLRLNRQIDVHCEKVMALTDVYLRHNSRLSPSQTI